MARTRFPADAGLTSRMLGTMFLLGLLYVVFVVVLYVLLGRESLPLILLIAGGFLFFQYF
ncbi:MAG TPA: zinc metalloprotease HtpX, partial [Actinomycetes bacterium]|nr:zinc metalloprotease HtpX [Actinomycetes bacterium]